MELRGFEPLIPSMRTPGGAVVRGRWGRSATGRSRMKSLTADDVAVLVCCTTSGVGVTGLAGNRGLGVRPGLVHPGSHATAAQSVVVTYTGMNARVRVRTATRTVTSDDHLAPKRQLLDNSIVCLHGPTERSSDLGDRSGHWHAARRYERPGLIRKLESSCWIGVRAGTSETSRMLIPR